ncbi:MAG: ribosome-binding factor [Gammaproteobacteria bacterium]|nr:ribosome-binding factor [Gammaproteobacteria bacterium]
MSRRTRERDVSSELFDSEFERALEETENQRRDRGRRIEQKTQQLCRQVQRALNLALVAQSADGALDDVFIVGVSAMGGCGHLLAHVSVPAGHPADVVLKALRDRSAQLRAVVAGFISRKRTPELSFVVAPPGGDYE